MILSIAKEFTETPGPRLRNEGDFSGEQFLDEVLSPRFEKACAGGETLMIDLDGTEGYATSFLEASFGGLARKFGVRDVLSALEFKSEDEPYLVEEIKAYIQNAQNK